MLPHEIEDSTKSILATARILSCGTFYKSNEIENQSLSALQSIRFISVPNKTSLPHEIEDSTKSILSCGTFYKSNEIENQSLPALQSIRFICVPNKTKQNNIIVSHIS
nr:hypothetical protein [uncultured Flavobacterium sp.]